jgi:hypothetical protein
VRRARRATNASHHSTVEQRASRAGQRGRSPGPYRPAAAPGRASTRCRQGAPLGGPASRRLRKRGSCGRSCFDLAY